MDWVTWYDAFSSADFLHGELELQTGYELLRGPIKDIVFIENNKTIEISNFWVASIDLKEDFNQRIWVYKGAGIFTIKMLITFPRLDNGRIIFPYQTIDDPGLGIVYSSEWPKLEKSNIKGVVMKLPSKKEEK